MSSRRSSRSPLICRICGDIARGLNFDVITCMSCKAFFRRNALRPNVSSTRKFVDLIKINEIIGFTEMSVQWRLSYQQRKSNEMFSMSIKEMFNLWNETSTNSIVFTNHWNKNM